ncbi:TonB-dependent receptor domain-containing protein [Sphingopyxis fribergensis]
MSFADDTMIYAFYSRGYKGGGANPPPAQPINESLVVSEIPPTFEPEFVNAFEVGLKNSFMGGSLTLNGSAFYYDYTDYQVSKVVDRTVVNENFDASVWGAELETVWMPAPRLRFNATLGYLDTRIKNGERSIDIFNRTQGRDGWSVISPWVQQTSNCILPNDYLAEIVNFGLFPAPATFASAIIQACNSWTGVDALGHLGLSFDPADYPEANNGAGFYADLSGNELPNSPHTTFNLGAQYTVPAGDWEMTLRGDYYRQSGSYARVYNLESDRLRGWDNVNLSLTVERPSDDLVFQAYVKNVFNKTPITDAFLNSDSTGMTTNVFTLDPRIIGFSVRKGF